MKKLIVFTLLVGLTTICHSQVKPVDQTKINVSVQGGIGLNGITKSENYDAKVGYRFGVGAEFPINQTWSLQTGIQLLNRNYAFDKAAEFIGTTEEGNEVMGLLSINAKTNAMYIQIPIKLAALLPINNNCGLQFSAGPYFAYGIGGKSSLEWALATSEHLPSDDELITPSGNNTKLQQGYNKVTTFGNEGLKRIDIGISLGADFRYKCFFTGLGIEYGCLPIDKEFPKDVFQTILSKSQTAISPHNFSIEMHVGYHFTIGK